MTNRQNPSFPTPIRSASLLHLVILVCFVVVVSYLAARLGGALVLRPEMIWPLWPGCAFLVAVLLLTPRKIWPAILPAGLAGFALYDLQENLPIRTIGLLLLADSIEILVAALGVRYLFAGVPHLNSVKSLAKYSLFAVILAPISVASTAGNALEGDSWWVGFFTEALALLSLTPAILSWTEIAPTRARRPKVHYLEAAALFVGLGTVAYFTFVASGIESRPALLYSLVPFLLWAALRFGITGISNSMVLVAFLAILGVVHGQGPFRGNTPVNDVLSLQLFLLVSASSFMVLAAVVEGHKTAEQTVRERETALRASEERLRLALHAARIGSFDWDIQTGVTTWTTELETMYGLQPGGFSGAKGAFESLVHPEDRAEVAGLADASLKTRQPTTGEWRVIWPDESVHWIAGRWQVFMDAFGEPSKMIGVNIDVTERRMAEQALKQMNRALEERTSLLQSREELLKVFVKHVPAAVAMLDRDMRYLQVSDRWCADFSLDSSQMLGRSHYEIFPELPERWKEIHRRCLAGETLRAEEDRWECEGDTMWSRWEIRPWQNLEGVQGGILIFSEDISRRKQMEETFSGMSRKLMEAQEKERARIARELHDDINQRLAMLAIELEQLQNDPSEIRQRVSELRKQTTEISNDVQAVSHDLHSSKLEYLGAVQGMKSWCKEFGERQGLRIEFKSLESQISLPPEIGLCLFRVLQEALHNAAKHSGVRRIEVQVRKDSGEIHLVVSDLGKGFDWETAMQGRGLGLTSMQERVRLVNGTIEIQSKPMGGTTVHVRFPFDSEKFSERAVG